MTEVICSDTGSGRGRGKSKSREKRSFSNKEAHLRAEYSPAILRTQRAFPHFGGVLCNF